MKKLILATASLLALGIAGSGIGNAAESTNTPGASAQPPSSSTTMSQSPQAATAPVNVSESEIKQAQEQLKEAGLYKGADDGKMGPETKQAISEKAYASASGDTICCGGVRGGMLEQRANINRSG